MRISLLHWKPDCRGLYKLAVVCYTINSQCKLVPILRRMDRNNSKLKIHWSKIIYFVLMHILVRNFATYVNHSCTLCQWCNIYWVLTFWLPKVQEQKLEPWTNNNISMRNFNFCQMYTLHCETSLYMKNDKEITDFFTG